MSLKQKNQALGSGDMEAFPSAKPSGKGSKIQGPINISTNPLERIMTPWLDALILVT